MTTAPFWQDDRSAIYLGDARDVLAAMPAGSADCIVTSPPYWAKRDYSVAGQYGPKPPRPPTSRPCEPCSARRGASWPTTALAGSTSATPTQPEAARPRAARLPRLRTHRTPRPAWRAKNLLGLPWRVALALQDDGWILRNAIVWHKPNAMPESVRDRMTCRYELLFLLVKSRLYWFDLDPIRVPRTPRTASRIRPGRPRPRLRPAAPARRPPDSPTRPKYSPAPDRSPRPALRRASRTAAVIRNGRNPGDVWSIPTRPYRARTSPPSRSNCRPGASRPDASLAAPCSTPSRHRHHRPGRARPRSAVHRHRDSTPRSPPWPPNGSGMPPPGNQTSSDGERQ